MWQSSCVLFVMLFVTPLAGAEVFKCVGKFGEDLYQNFPCQFDSMARTRVNAQGPKKSTAVPKEPRVGMKADEVRALWGEPTNTVQEEPGEGSRFEVWSYSDSRSVRFDHRGRVTFIQQ